MVFDDIYRFLAFLGPSGGARIDLEPQNKKREIKKWKQRVIDAREVDDPDPPSTEYMGECFLKISENLAWRPNFINYTFRDDLVSDGIENCLQYVSNFNSEKSSNPFAYFTQIIYYAFVRRIQKEKKQTHIRNKMIENKVYESYTTMEGDNTSYSVRGFDPDVLLPDEDVYKPKKKTVEKRKGLENFMEDKD